MSHWVWEKKMYRWGYSLVFASPVLTIHYNPHGLWHCHPHITLSTRHFPTLRNHFCNIVMWQTTYAGLNMRPCDACTWGLGLARGVGQGHDFNYIVYMPFCNYVHCVASPAVWLGASTILVWCGGSVVGRTWQAENNLLISAMLQCVLHSQGLPNFRGVFTRGGEWRVPCLSHRDHMPTFPPQYPVLWHHVSKTTTTKGCRATNCFDRYPFWVREESTLLPSALFSYC